MMLTSYSYVCDEQDIPAPPTSRMLGQQQLCFMEELHAPPDTIRSPPAPLEPSDPVPKGGFVFRAKYHNVTDISNIPIGVWDVIPFKPTGMETYLQEVTIACEPHHVWWSLKENGFVAQAKRSI